MVEGLSVGESNEFEQSLLYGIKQREELSSVVFSEKLQFRILFSPLVQRERFRLQFVKIRYSGIIKVHMSS